ncbi:MBL fold metallo-hydrolase [Salinarchaeum chitinilyticum]
MKLEFLGGAQEVGRSAILVNDRLLLDYGMASGTPPGFPVGDVEPDAVVVSHGHLDHVGTVPTLCSGDRRPPIHWTPPTRDLCLTLARDTLKLRGGTYDCPFTETEIQRVTQVSEPHGYRESFEAAGHEITFYDAGHIPGSAHVLIDDGDTRLFYSADFHTEDQRLLPASTARPEADAVLLESTYADVERPPRPEIEQSFVDAVETTLWEGGTVVVPAFAIGRTQEILMVCAAHDLPTYVDGMGQDVTRTVQQYPEFLRDADALRDAAGHARFVRGKEGQRERIAEESAVIVTTSGMLNGGPAMTYVPEIAGNPTNLIAMTGYQVEGTPGRELLDTGSAPIDGDVLRVAAGVERFDFSAHADRPGLGEFLEPYDDATVLVNHGDRCAEFAAELRDEDYSASAPEIGDVVEL